MIRDIWPLAKKTALPDRLALKIGSLPGYCIVCGRFTMFDVSHPNFREHVPCRKCGSRNRQRQIAAVLLSYAFGGNPKALACLADLPRHTVIWNAESTRALHESLAVSLGKNHIASEYIDPALASGESMDGVLHVDMQNTHFKDDSLDFVLSSDVLEHVPHPLRALEETWRILKPGGCHIFTAPFYHHRFTNERRARLNEDGDVEHMRKPWYHDDPLREQGTLVYNIFAPELLCMLEQVGFEARLCRLHSPFYGLLGANGIVMVARKVRHSYLKQDWIFPDAS